MRSLAHSKIAGKMLLNAASCFLLLLFAVQGHTKVKISSNSIPSDVSLQIQAHPKTVTVGDHVRIQMDIAMPEGYQVEVSRPAGENGDFLVVDFSSGPIPLPAGAEKAPSPSRPTAAYPIVRHRTHIDIAVYRTGKFSFPALPLNIKTAQGTEIAAKSPPVEIEIRSVLPEKDPVLKNLKKQADIADPMRPLLLAGLVAACALLAALLWHVLKRKRKTPLPLAPAQTQNLLDLAEADLHSLLACGKPDRGEEKAFYVALSEIVKRILDAAYSINATERTTAEIIDVLHDRREPNSETRKLIVNFLGCCDVVKFAKYIPADTEHEAASQSAQQILAEARKAVGSRE